MQNATDQQCSAILDLLERGPDYIRVNPEHVTNVLRAGIDQGLNNTPRWEGYRARVYEILKG